MDTVWYGSPMACMQTGRYTYGHTDFHMVTWYVCACMTWTGQSSVAAAASTLVSPGGGLNELMNE